MDCCPRRARKQINSRQSCFCTAHPFHTFLRDSAHCFVHLTAELCHLLVYSHTEGYWAEQTAELSSISVPKSSTVLLVVSFKMIEHGDSIQDCAGSTRVENIENVVLADRTIFLNEMCFMNFKPVSAVFKQQHYLLLFVPMPLDNFRTMVFGIFKLCL